MFSIFISTWWPFSSKTTFLSFLFDSVIKISSQIHVLNLRSNLHYSRLRWHALPYLDFVSIFPSSMILSILLFCIINKIWYKKRLHYVKIFLCHISWHKKRWNSEIIWLKRLVYRPKFSILNFFQIYKGNKNKLKEMKMLACTCSREC